MKLKWLAAAVALAALAIILVQWRTASALRQEIQQQLKPTEAPPPPVQKKPSDGEKRFAENEEIERLRRENRDLHKLRNEVAQLRKQKSELERAQAENARLRQVKQAREQVLRLPEMPGYVPKESWADAGFSTPEAVAQTYFWALGAARFDRVLECMAPHIRQTVGKEFQNPSDKQREEMAAVLGEFKGYRLAEKTVVSDDEVVLGLQATAFGEKTFKIPLKRFGNEWKISGDPKP